MPSNQHYVPRFLLKHFCSDDSERLWAYDKSTGKTFQTNVKNVASERDFYEGTIEGRVLSLEDGLSQLEGDTAVIIDRIVSRESIGDLSERERVQIAVFVSIQLQRGPNLRQQLLAMNTAMKQALRDRDVDASDVEGWLDMTEEDAKAMSLAMLTQPNEFPLHILNKTWLLFETSAEMPFYISDNPVAMQNLAEPKGPLRGNLGLAVPGIEVYLPISSTLAMGFFCRTYETAFREGIDRMRRSIAIDPSFPMDFGPLLHWKRAIRKGNAMSSAPENVLNHNSLQVQQAERFVFCRTPDFTLVEEMIADEPRFRVGPRLTIT